MSNFKTYIDLASGDLAGTFETITATACADEADPGSSSCDIDMPRMEYTGAIEPDWDGSQTARMPDGRPVLITKRGRLVVLEPNGRFAEVTVKVKVDARYAERPHSQLFEALCEEFARIPTKKERDAAIEEARLFIEKYRNDRNNKED